ncbi:hypothetical protein HZB01_00055 [Candidatus Woesearchaeota archaeon]|nr:hypothetical protein [Candidatus Woesearchaeota archaeon]
MQRALQTLILVMEITHTNGNEILSQNVPGQAAFLLTNRSGGFYAGGLPSRYSGLFFDVGGRLLKVVDDILVDGNYTAITCAKNTITRRLGKQNECFWMPNANNILIYEQDTPRKAGIFLDVRHPYDDRQWGRQYEMEEYPGGIIIHYTKVGDSRDGDAYLGTEYEMFIVIRADKGTCIPIRQWIKKEYSFDAARKASITTRYVFHAADIRAKQVVIACAATKEEAIALAAQFPDKQDDFTSPSFLCKNNEQRMASLCAAQSLRSLQVNGSSIYAGLPWFFQFWSRDEAICLGALLLLNEVDLAKSILMKQLHSIEHDGRLANRIPPTPTGSADAIGWHFRRWLDFARYMRQQKRDNVLFDKHCWDSILAKLSSVVSQYEQNYCRDGFFFNNPKETWMDSVDRSGVRLEVQAQAVGMYECMYELTLDTRYAQKKEALLKRIKSSFWNGTILADGLEDWTVRPNLFIAAYHAPKLLTSEEWVRCFEFALQKLWLPWGGIATIDTHDSRFCDNHTGEDARSYHNGDSWFWLNNLAAMVLWKTNRKVFKRYIKIILHASTTDILWSGCAGHHSELSSAGHQAAEGCLCQAWSSALYLELLHELTDVYRNQKEGTKNG